MAVALALASVALAQSPVPQKFDSRGHPKAKSTWVTVRYPAGWRAAEGERPDIVQKFTGQYSGFMGQLMLQVRSAGGPVEAECASLTPAEWVDVFTGPGISVTNMRAIRHERKPGALFEMASKIERAGNTGYVHQQVMAVCEKDRLIMVWCGTGSLNSAQETRHRTAVLTPVCKQFFNSLVLMENY